MKASAFSRRFLSVVEVSLFAVDSAWKPPCSIRDALYTSTADEVSKSEGSDVADVAGVVEFGYVEVELEVLV